MEAKENGGHTMYENLNTNLEEKVLRIADQYTDLVELR